MAYCSGLSSFFYGLFYGQPLLRKRRPDFTRKNVSLSLTHIRHAVILKDYDGRNFLARRRSRQ